jgi:ADP-heptose:LPS heptosyltransferase
MRKAAVLNWLVYKFVRTGRNPPPIVRWRVGIYKADRLGDFVLSMGAIRKIVEIAGENNCVLFHSAASSQIACREFPNVARIEVPSLDGRLWKTRRRLRNFFAKEMGLGGVDQLLCLRHFRALADDLALQIIPAARVWCIRNSSTSSQSYELVKKRFDGDLIIERPKLSLDSEICEDLRCHESLLSHWAGISYPLGDIRPRIRPTRPQSKKTLALAPFGSSSLRDLPIEGVAACVVHAKLALGLDATLISPPDAIPRYEAFAGQLANKGAIVNVEVAQTYDELVDKIASCAALLTTETATAHIATAMDCRMVCVIGGGHYGLFGPWCRSGRQVWVNNFVPCYNCNWHCIHTEPICITHVETERLIQALEQVFKSHSAVPIQAHS